MVTHNVLLDCLIAGVFPLCVLHLHPSLNNTLLSDRFEHIVDINHQTHLALSVAGLDKLLRRHFNSVLESLHQNALELLVEFEFTKVLIFRAEAFLPQVVDHLIRAAEKQVLDHIREEGRIT